MHATTVPGPQGKEQYRENLLRIVGEWVPALPIQWRAAVCSPETL